MNHSRPARHFGRVMLWLAVIGTSTEARSDPHEPALAMRLLKASCLSCHNDEKRKGGLSFTTREELVKGGENGAVVVDGKPEESPLLTSLAADADPHMPPKKQLSAAQVGLLTDWVRAGFRWDAAALAGEASAPRPVALSALPAAYRPVLALALSPDGSRLAAGCRNDVVLLDVTPAGLVFRARARAHLDPVQSIAWSPDGTTLITGAFRRVIVWQAEPLTQRSEIIAGLTDRITALRALPGGGPILLADGQVAESGVVRVLDIAAGQITRSWPAHDDTIFAMSLSADGKLLATAGGDKRVKLWDVASGAEVAGLEAHATQVLGLAFNPDASQLVTAGADHQLKVWDVKTRENTILLANKATAFNAVHWAAAGPAVFAVADDGALLRFTDLKSHTGAQSSEAAQERQLAKVDAALYCVTVTDNGERLFAGSSDGHILGWDKDGKLLDDIDALTANHLTAPPPP